MLIELKDVRASLKTIEKHIRKTKLSFSTSLTQRLGKKGFLKFENEQLTGSFKIRGAFNKMHSLSDEEKLRGVVACSAGNHAQGVAYAATQLGVTSHVIMPETASMVKASATQGYGAKIIFHGDIFDQAFDHARTLENDEGYIFVHPFEDPMIIAGQGTVALEILEQLPDLDTLLVPIGGGGLISGMATVIKALRPQCRIFGVQAEKAHGMVDLFKKTDEEIQVAGATIADGIALKHPSQKMCEDYISRLVDDVFVASEDEIAEAMVFLLERSKSVVEGAGAVGLAAALAGRIPLGEKCCFILSGGNIDMNIVSKVIENGLCHRGRLVKLSVVIDDLPGNLNRLTKVLADNRANILQINHDRISDGLFLRETRVDFLLETVGPEHIEAIQEALVGVGALIL